MANGHGGPRPGAGRPAKAEKYGGQIAAAEDHIADRLPELLEREFALATGGAERVERVYELALGILIDDTALNPSGTVVKIKRQLFPNAQPDALVLVSEKRVTPEPDRAAIEYLIDRILGKPTASIEAEVKTDMGDAFLTAFGGALTKIYGIPGNQESSGE